MAAVVQAADVIVEPEDGRALVARVVAADAFEEAGAVVEGVREDVNLRVGEVDEAPVHPDFFDFFERHRSLLIGGQRWTGNSGAPGLKVAGV